MFKILQRTLTTGIVTTACPAKPAALSGYTRARPAADVCPPGAIRIEYVDRTRQVTID